MYHSYQTEMHSLRTQRDNADLNKLTKGKELQGRPQHKLDKLSKNPIIHALLQIRNRCEELVSESLIDGRSKYKI